MLKVCLGLFTLCVLLASVSLTVQGGDILDCLNDSNSVGTCFSIGPSEKSFIDEDFSMLLEKYANEGARIWTPSATERFQMFLDTR